MSTGYEPETRHIRRRDDWRGTMLTWLWAVTCAVVGLLITTMMTEQDELRKALNAQAVKQATYEADAGNMKQRLEEIKTLLYQVLSHQQQQLDRRR